MLFFETNSTVNAINTIIIIKKGELISLSDILVFLLNIVYRKIIFVVIIIIVYVAKLGKNICMKIVFIKLSNIFET